MLILGSSYTEKINLLIEQYVRLIESGTSYDEILVILLNSYKKSCFIQKLLELKPDIDISKTKIYTIYGLCYNAFLDNYDYIRKITGIENVKIKPNLCGLEVSQYIFKQSIKEADFTDYISKINLLHQLFRRYSLIVQNSLTIEEVMQKSKILDEVFAKDAQKAINDYKLKTIEYNSYDYLRQIAIFSKIYENTDYFKSINFLFIDDADELSYIIWQFIEYLLPSLKNYFIAADIEGSSRCGYLCAYKSAIEKFIKKYNPEIIKLEEKNTFYNFAVDFYNNIKKGQKTKFNVFSNLMSVKRLDMIDSVINDICILLKKGVKNSEISIISPLIDDVLLDSLNDRNNLKFQILSGSEKLCDVKTIKFIITVLKLVNNIEIQEYELRSIFVDLLNIPMKKVFSLIKKFENTKIISDFDFGNDEYNDKYCKFIAVINSMRKSNNCIEDQIKIIYTNLVKEFQKDIDIKKYDFLVKEARSFEIAFNNKVENLVNEFILQIENSVISENPVNSFELEKNAIIVSSPQKIIDFNIKTKYQFWLDVSHNEWFKQDTGTLYNAWVLSKDWEKDNYTFDDNISLTRDKTARIVRKLMLLATKSVAFYSSLYDNSGNENFGGLADYIEAEHKSEKKEFNITPRNDQKPVLNYKKGKMGIMAVPGAGKTTILLALIIKLINEGIKPENIFVLTYMESAAKNFKEKIKASISDTYELPNISTIHGLALRIIKENGNYSKVGLDENFEICDDNTKEKIIKELFYTLKLDEEKYDNYLRCISVVKLSKKNERLYSVHKEIQEFFDFYNEYNKQLKSNNLIDYDDMLCYAVEILNNNEEILNYYQSLCQYIIEDEAQDSSEIQQILINLLAGKYKNIVRCGDINQSITATFTNADLEKFRNFLSESYKVEMNCSQRCSKPIYTLANELIKIASSNSEMKNTFYSIKMEETGKNPKSDKKPEYLTFEKEQDEKFFILEKIKEIQRNEPDSSIAILLRLNSQVNDYNSFFLSQGIQTSVRSDSLSQKNIYKIIFAILKVIQNPLKNEYIFDLLNVYRENNILSVNIESFEFLKNLKVPFITLSDGELKEESLLQLYWDVDYWINKSTLSIDMIALQIGLYYSKNTVDKSNTYLVSTFIKRLTTNNETYEEILKKLEYIAMRPLSAYKFFEDENQQEENKLSIMTMHKSKGDEFDYVFIPQMNEENYPLTLSNIKLKNGGHFVQSVKNALLKTGIKMPDVLKREQLEETLRLLYVGITRARKELYLTTANNYKIRKNIKISEFIKNLCAY